MNMKQKNFVSAVVYLRDAEKTITGFLKMLYGELRENFEKFEIICVDDASEDGSVDAVRSLAGGLEGCMLSVVSMSFYQGAEAAMRAGIDLAIGDFVFEFDGTASDFGPGVIMQCYNRCLQGFDIVSCGNGRQRVFSKLFYLVYNRNSGAPYKLRSETFRVISRRAVNRVHSMSVNTPYRKALYSNCGLKSDYINYEPEKSGSAHGQSLKDPYDTALTSLILFTNIAYKATLIFTFIMMLATVGSIGYVIAVYIIGAPVSGYTTMMILISGAFFALFAILAVIIKYLSVILGLVFHKQKYMIESIEKLTK